jgi:SAM-dependent methyltransferase
MERIEAEQAFHDQQARQRQEHFARRPDSLLFADADYLDHETWIRPALARLGDVRGLRVLDFGCGHGMAAVVLGRRGARVTAFDLSAGYLAEARHRAAASKIDIAFLQVNGERLPFADAAFDRIWGNAILHHLDLPAAVPELRRILRPGGIAVFCEPWGGNPLLDLARQSLPYPGKQRTADERPLNPADVAVLRRSFPGLQIQGCQLLSMLRRVLPRGRFVQFLKQCDDQLLACWPGLQRFCRYVILTLPG